MVDKTRLRAEFAAKRSALTPSFRQQASQAICETLRQHPILLTANIIAVYCGADGEADPFPIVNQLAGKQWLLPVVNNKTQLSFVSIDNSGTLIKNKYGILEPERKDNTIAPEDIDAMLIPLVAFDLSGNRIGRGAGYYDRALSFMQHQTTPTLSTVGIAYEFQKVPHIAADLWDIPLQLVITEKNCYQIA